MISLNQTDVNKISYKGCIEGIRFLSHVVNDTANDALASADQPDYEKVEIVWLCNGETVYSGDLASFVQYMLNREYLTHKSDRLMNLIYLKQECGQIVNAAKSGVNEEAIADLSVAFAPYYGEHEITVRMKSPYAASADAGSYLIVDFDKSDEIGLEKFKIVKEAVTIAANKSLLVDGLCKCLMWVQSDNQFITDNNGAYNSTDKHPVSSINISSDYSENLLTGAEQQVINARSFNGYLVVTPGVVGTSVTTVAKKRLQKSVRLSDEEFLLNPKVSLQLNSGSMVSSVGYSIMYDVLQFDVTSARSQALVDGRLNKKHQAIKELLKGQF